ncbi:translation elongation factor Ts [Vicingaceae bacterium]|jgi:elongation factor Ts|nr:translation elongation factor Ts [Vicingaceae bacterium]
MATITAAEVNELRKKTGAGMMDCKKALVEANGDFEQAIDLLRKKGQKIAANRGDRDAKEGLVIAKATADNKKGVMVVVNCETDFVAKNDDFAAFANNILDAVMDNGATTVDAAKALTYPGSSLSIADRIIEEVGKIGEKIDLSAIEIIESELVVAYNHPGNSLASLVAVSKAGDAEAEAARNVAMQVAAMNPIALNDEGVDSETIERELEIGRDQARQEGKPEAMIDKIAQGKLSKFYKENTLVKQQFIKDNSLTVEAYLISVNKELVATGFKRISLS